MTILNNEKETHAQDQTILDLLSWLEDFYKREMPNYRTYSPEGCEGYHPHVIKPATRKQINDFEKLFGEPLPNDYKTFLLNNHICHNFRYNYDCLDIKSVISEWRGMNKLLDKGIFDDGRVEHHKKEHFGNWTGKKIKEVWWSKKWLPISKDSCGNMKCIDFDPAKNGKKYQIMSMEIQDGQGPFASSDKSFTKYLNWFVTYLRLKKYEVYDWGIEITS